MTGFFPSQTNVQSLWVTSPKNQVMLKLLAKVMQQIISTQVLANAQEADHYQAIVTSSPLGTITVQISGFTDHDATSLLVVS